MADPGSWYLMVIPEGLSPACVRTEAYSAGVRVNETVTGLLKVVPDGSASTARPGTMENVVSDGLTDADEMEIWFAPAGRVTVVCAGMSMVDGTEGDEPVWTSASTVVSVVTTPSDGTDVVWDAAK